MGAGAQCKRFILCRIQKAKEASLAAGGLPQGEDPPLPPLPPSDPAYHASSAPDLDTDIALPPAPPPLPPSLPDSSAQEAYDPFAATEHGRGSLESSSTLPAAGGRGS